MTDQVIIIWYVAESSNIQDCEIIIGVHCVGGDDNDGDDNDEEERNDEKQSEQLDGVAWIAWDSWRHTLSFLIRTSGKESHSQAGTPCHLPFTVFPTPFLVRGTFGDSRYFYHIFAAHW